MNRMQHGWGGCRDVGSQGGVIRITLWRGGIERHPAGRNASGATWFGGTYGPTPPVWQSAQFTCVRSPMSTGCWKPVGATTAAVAVPSDWDIMLWHWLQSRL